MYIYIYTHVYIYIYSGISNINTNRASSGGAAGRRGERRAAGRAWRGPAPVVNDEFPYRFVQAFRARRFVQAFRFECTAFSECLVLTKPDDGGAVLLNTWRNILTTPRMWTARCDNMLPNVPSIHRFARRSGKSYSTIIYIYIYMCI